MAFEKVKNIPDLIKLENSIFVLPFTYIGMLLASSYTIVTFILITIALLSARGAAFAVNRYVGRRYDLRNPKKKRWISLRLYTKFELATIFIFFAIVFLASAYALNILAFILAPIILLIVIIEPHFKKYTEHRHLIMGFIIGLGVLGGYIGAQGAFPTTWPVYVLMFGYMFYSAANDIIYSLNHVTADRLSGLKTYPVEYGVKNSMLYSFNYHSMAAVLFVIFGILNNSAIIIIAAFIVYIIFVLEYRILDYTRKWTLHVSFFNYNAVVSIIMLLAVILFKLGV